MLLTSAAISTAILKHMMMAISVETSSATDVKIILKL
jgi:hypothetical protein